MNPSLTYKPFRKDLIMKTANAISLKRVKLKDGTEGTNVIERFCDKAGLPDTVLQSMVADVTKWHEYKAVNRKDDLAQALDKKVSGLKATLKGYAFYCRFVKDTVRLPRLIATLDMRDDTYTAIYNQLITLTDEMDKARKGSKKVEVKVKLASGYDQQVAA